MKLVTATTLLLSLAAVPVIANGESAHSTQNNPSGPYLGVGWGKFDLNIRNLSDVGTATSNIVKSNDDAWKAFVGWRFNPYVAVEGAYIDFGKPNDRFTATGSNGNYRVSLSGFAPSIVGSIPLGPVELFAKAGSYFYNVKVRVDFDNPGPDLNSSHSRNDFLYGGGIGFTIANHLHLRAEYETLDIKNAKNSDAFWLSAAYRF
jgi:opacity protein-like surface antigen